MKHNFKTRFAIVNCLIFLFLSVTLQGSAQSSSNDSAGVHIAMLSATAHNFAKHGDKKSALYYHKQALQKAKDFNLPEQEARTLLNIAQLLKKEDAGKSLEHLQAALKIAKQINHEELQADIYLAMVEIYKQQENYSEALHALKEHHHLLDSLFSEGRAKEIARIQLIDDRNSERTLMLSILSSVILIVIILGFYYRKIKKLNSALQQSNIVKNKLFSILAHDLRGPAGNIAQSISMIEAGMLPPDAQQQILTLLKPQSELFVETLNTLLEWAHGQLQGTTSSPERFDAKAIIKKNIILLSGQSTSKQIVIKDNTPDILSLLADEHHFDIIIRNLLSNAIKFSHTEGVINIGMEATTAETIFSVSDEGIGISASRQKQLNTAGIDVAFGTNGEKGTGLGLLLAKEFTHADGGKIWLTSEEGKGTTFYFSIKNKE